jgi:hypothetical protein
VGGWGVGAGVSAPFVVNDGAERRRGGGVRDGEGGAIRRGAGRDGRASGAPGGGSLVFRALACALEDGGKIDLLCKTTLMYDPRCGGNFILLV